MKLTLRTRLLLNLVPFVILLLATGIYAIALFSRYADQVESTVSGNYQSILIAQSMSSAVSAMDKEAWISIGGTNGLSPTFVETQRQFEDNLAVLTNRATLPGETELLKTLSADYQYFIAFVRALQEPNRERLERKVYQDRVIPRTLGMDSTLRSIRDLNDAEVLAAGQSIQKITTNITRLMLLGMVVALLLTGYACYQLGRSILKPIQAITAATRKLGEGKWDKPVPIVSGDELGQLGSAFNRMAEQLQEYRESTTEQIVRLHRTMEGTLTSFPDPVFVLNRAAQIEVKNPAAEAFSTHLGIQSRLPSDLQIACESVLKRDVHYLPQSYESALGYRIGGAERFYLPRILALHDKLNVFFGVAVVLHDVTRFRLLDAAKTNLVATVSHELKTPLTGIRMTLHLLLDKTLGLLPPAQEELLEGAREDVERLLRILHDLLDLARLDEGITELHREPTAPDDLLQPVIEETSGAVAAHGLTVELRVETELPTVSVDHQLIRHVFTNLVSNAVKHSPSGGKIVLRAARDEEDGVRFSVMDSGAGIPPEFHARVFDRFFRVPGQNKTGAGLGLSIAREITVAHGGRIGVRSSPGKGSTFYVVLPGTKLP